MRNESRPILYGAVAAGALVAAFLAFNHFDVRLSTYGGWFESYAWSHSDFSMNTGDVVTFAGLTATGAGTGALVSYLFSKR